MSSHRINGYWHKCLWALCLGLLLLLGAHTRAQENQPRIEDTTHTVESDKPARLKQPLASDTVKRHSPKKAALYSACLPGFGQAYNKKYWKIPIVYAGFAGLATGIALTGKQYRVYREAYRTLANNTSIPTIDINGHAFNATQAADFKNYYKRNMDLCSIFTAVWYVLNIVDATVDAHLFEYDISDKLTMHVEPTYQYQATGAGFVGLKMNLRL